MIDLKQKLYYTLKKGKTKVTNLKQIFLEYGFELNENQVLQFKNFFEMLVQKNKVMNLTAITEENEVVLKHFLDSCLPANFLPQNASVIDVGSGAGFPAIPLKILRPDLNITMLDSLLKRVNFLDEVIQKLNLKNIVAVHGRAEDFAKQNREKFDVSLARAVAPLNTLLEYLLPLTRQNGISVIYKSSKIFEELENAQNALKILGAKQIMLQEYYLKQIDAKRFVLILEKTSKTPQKYPRSKNLPKQKPL